MDEDSPIWMLPNRRGLENNPYNIGDSVDQLMIKIALQFPKIPIYRLLSGYLGGKSPDHPESIRIPLLIYGYHLKSNSSGISISTLIDQISYIHNNSTEGKYWNYPEIVLGVLTEFVEIMPSKDPEQKSNYGSTIFAKVADACGSDTGNETLFFPACYLLDRDEKFLWIRENGNTVYIIQKFENFDEYEKYKNSLKELKKI